MYVCMYVRTYLGVYIPVCIEMDGGALFVSVRILTPSVLL